MAELVVWHDGACPLCRLEISVLRRLDRGGAIRFVDAVAEPDACPLDPQAMLARFHARENGVMLSGAAAFAAIWRAIPILWPLGFLARNGHVLNILEWLYIGFLRQRPRWQKLARKMQGARQ